MIKKFSIRSGFTLIELLIVIAILGVLAAATLAILDPVDKLRAGNDSKVQTDIVAIGNAAEAFATEDPSNAYPTSVAAMVASGALRSAPVAPGGYTAYAWAGGGAAPFTVSGQLRSKKFTSAGNIVFKYTSGTGKSCAAAAVAGNCP